MIPESHSITIMCITWAYYHLLVQIVSISGQPQRAYYKFPEPEPWSAGGALLSQDRLCETVIWLLYGDWIWHCTLSSDNPRPISSTSNVPTNRRNIHHHQALLWRFHDSDTEYNSADFLTYLLITLKQHIKETQNNATYRRKVLKIKTLSFFCMLCCTPCILIVSIAVSQTSVYTLRPRIPRYWDSTSHGVHVYSPAFTGTHFTTLEGWPGWVDLGGWLNSRMLHM